MSATDQLTISENRKLIFVSMSDQANGAENVLLAAATVTNSVIIFLKKVKQGGLHFKVDQKFQYVTNKSMLAGFSGLIKSLKNYRKDYTIISTHSYLNAFLGFLKRIGYLRSKLIVRECTSVFTRYKGLKKLSYKLSYRLGYPAVDLVVCQTDLMKTQFIENNNFIHSDRVIVQENPIDLGQTIANGYTPINDPDLKSDFICAAGRLIPEKGFNILIASFAPIAKQYPDLNLLILGEGRQRALLTEQVSALKLEGRVKFKGWIENPHPYFLNARVCVVSSVREGFPNVLLQMMALNRHVVSTLCAGGVESIPGILTTGVNDVDGLVKVLRIALHRNFIADEINQKAYLNKRSPETFVNSILKALH